MSWYCKECDAIVPDRHVTYTEEHDPAHGGCGCDVTSLEPPVEPRQPDENDIKIARLREELATAKSALARIAACVDYDGDEPDKIAEQVLKSVMALSDGMMQSDRREREALAGNLSELQREITEWGKATFPNSTLDSVYAHWKDEIDEFMRAHRGEGGFVGEEMADYLILSFQYASFFGFDLLTELLNKFEKNKGRAWGEPDERGVVRHVREAREQEVTRG